MTMQTQRFYKTTFFYRPPKLPPSPMLVDGPIRGWSRVDEIPWASWIRPYVWVISRQVSIWSEPEDIGEGLWRSERTVFVDPIKPGFDGPVILCHKVYIPKWLQRIQGRRGDL